MVFKLIIILISGLKVGYLKDKIDRSFVFIRLLLVQNEYNIANVLI